MYRDLMDCSENESYLEEIDLVCASARPLVGAHVNLEHIAQLRTQQFASLTLCLKSALLSVVKVVH